jgi:hypothetical protein
MLERLLASQGKTGAKIETGLRRMEAAIHSMRSDLE